MLSFFPRQAERLAWHGNIVEMTYFVSQLSKSISHPTDGGRLSWCEWLVTYQGGLVANGHSMYSDFVDVTNAVIARPSHLFHFLSFSDADQYSVACQKWQSHSFAEAA